MSPTTLQMFDFDGTLFCSPHEPPWFQNPHPWWGSNEESLGPPCVPIHPGPSWWVPFTVRAARSAYQAPGTVTILCTGRYPMFRRRILGLCGQMGIQFHEAHFLTIEGVRNFKTHVLKDCLTRYPTVETLHIWEDENLTFYHQHMEQWARAAGRKLTVVPHSVKAPPKQVMCGPEGFAPERVKPGYRAP